MRGGSGRASTNGVSGDVIDKAVTMSFILLASSSRSGLSDERPDSPQQPIGFPREEVRLDGITP
jgi:hypothetical protein